MHLDNYHIVVGEEILSHSIADRQTKNRRAAATNKLPAKG
jgi:hypothetical protein